MTGVMLHFCVAPMVAPNQSPCNGTYWADANRCFRSAWAYECAHAATMWYCLESVLWNWVIMWACNLSADIPYVHISVDRLSFSFAAWSSKLIGTPQKTQSIVTAWPGLTDFGLTALKHEWSEYFSNFTLDCVWYIKDNNHIENSSKIRHCIDISELLGRFVLYFLSLIEIRENEFFQTNGQHIVFKICEKSVVLVNQFANDHEP